MQKNITKLNIYYSIVYLANITERSWITAGLLQMVIGEDPQVVLADVQSKAAGFVDCLSAHNLTQEIIYMITLDNAEMRFQIGQCALEVDPDFNLFGYD